LNSLSPQSRLAPTLLQLAGDVLLTDPAYVERIKRHYQLFREKIAQTPSSPRPIPRSLKLKKRRPKH